jgi:hypothetical protein
MRPSYIPRIGLGSFHKNMPKKHYSPKINRFLISALYHEAKARKIPMTRLTDDLLRQSLQGSEGWRIAKAPPPYPGKIA